MSTCQTDDAGTISDSDPEELLAISSCTACKVSHVLLKFTSWLSSRGTLINFFCIVQAHRNTNKTTLISEG